jgi:hypothetical protein
MGDIGGAGELTGLERGLDGGHGARGRWEETSRRGSGSR